MYFLVSVSHWVKMKRSKKIDKFLDLAKALKKAVKHEDNADAETRWCAWNGSQKLRRLTEENGNEGKERDYTDHSIVDIG